MTCEDVKQRLGEYFDGEVPVDLRVEIETHIASCVSCAKELNAIAALAARFTVSDDLLVPRNLWNAIEQKMESPLQKRHSNSNALTRVRGYALAACVLIAVILGGRALFQSRDADGVASAATVDFRVLLDGLSSDPVAAFERFLAHYHARSVAAEDAKKMASHLYFEIPQELPGGFRFEKSYVLEFGSETGIAVRYSRGSEFLGAIFHRPVQREEFGTHKDYECVVGKHRGHAVAVGEWKLVHLTDPTTCHCVLSKLDEIRELPPVMKALAPNSVPAEHHHGP